MTSLLTRSRVPATLAYTLSSCTYVPCPLRGSECQSWQCRVRIDSTDRIQRCASAMTSPGPVTAPGLVASSSSMFMSSSSSSSARRVRWERVRPVEVELEVEASGADAAPADGDTKRNMERSLWLERNLALYSLALSRRARVKCGTLEMFRSTSSSRQKLTSALSIHHSACSSF